MRGRRRRLRDPLRRVPRVQRAPTRRRDVSAVRSNGSARARRPSSATTTDGPRDSSASSLSIATAGSSRCASSGLSTRARISPRPGPLTNTLLPGSHAGPVSTGPGVLRPPSSRPDQHHAHHRLSRRRAARRLVLVERLVDEAAREPGVDPLELRRRNPIGADGFPYRTPRAMSKYDSGDPSAMSTSCGGRPIGMSSRRAVPRRRRAGCSAGSAARSSSSRPAVAAARG